MRRNLETAEPLSQHLGIATTRTPPDSVFHTSDTVREILDHHAGGVVVWFGNASGNLQTMYHRLGGTGLAPLACGELFIMTIPDQGPVRTEKLHYGPPRALDLAE